MKIRSNLEIYNSIRRTWGYVNPVTRVEKDKTKDVLKKRRDGKRICKNFDERI